MTTFTRQEKLDIARVFKDTGVIKGGDFVNGDTCGLWFHNSYLPMNGAHEIHRDLTKRWKLMARIEECRRADGKMWVSESGMDCDGVQYSGSMHECQADLRSYEQLGYDINSWADGPFSIYPITEEQRKEVVYQSRDLAMEAYEDGHPHVLSTVRFESN
jgi:hypothetical protein